MLPEQIKVQFSAENDRMRDNIVRSIAPGALELFCRKNVAYAGQGMMFGSTGELIEINRKYWKLHQIIWDGAPPDEFEGPIEVAQDMIGHLYMLIDYLEGGDYGRVTRGSQTEAGDQGTDGAGPSQDEARPSGPPVAFGR